MRGTDSRTLRTDVYTDPGDAPGGAWAPGAAWAPGGAWVTSLCRVLTTETTAGGTQELWPRSPSRNVGARRDESRLVERAIGGPEAERDVSGSREGDRRPRDGTTRGRTFVGVRVGYGPRLEREGRPGGSGKGLGQERTCGRDRGHGPRHKDSGEN